MKILIASLTALGFVFSGLSFGCSGCGCNSISHAASHSNSKAKVDNKLKAKASKTTAVGNETTGIEVDPNVTVNVDES